ncbi:helix-turn-helix domain-containing protein [Microtetraspora malaysiensis]|uniref:AraC family transcriptional regulator n=1 Tax=Microtetraspora malaysiensis TaxID=161358 RepID=UPI003D8EBA07
MRRPFMVNHATRDALAAGPVAADAATGAVGGSARGTISPHLTRLLLRAGTALGVDRSRLCGVPGIAVLDEDRIRIPTATILRVWELVSGPAWDAEGSQAVMRLWRPGTFGVWDYLFAAASTLGDALQAASRNFTAITDLADRLVLAHDEHGLTVTYHGTDQGHPQYSRIAEFVPHMLLTVASSAAGRRLAPVRVRLPQHAAGAPERLRELYHTTNIDFEGDHPSITFAEPDIVAPQPRADAALAAILDEHARLSTAAARPVLGWLDRFHAALERAIDGGPPDLEQVAQRLAMSPRTLQRHLREEGTTWREELERLRQWRVERLLGESSLSMESIAVRVGFTDARSLRRAIHRWYGHGPATLRASGPA